MYVTPRMRRTTINVNTSQEGETLEQKLDRIVNSKEPITDGAPIIYTDRKEGVLPAYNIRTDRFEIAVEAMDSVHRSAIARREKKAEKTLPNTQDENKGGDSGAEPTQAT